MVLVLVLIFGLGYYKNNQVPDKLGVEERRLAEVPSSPNAVSSQTKVSDKYVEPLKFKGDLDTSRQIILSILKDDDQITIISEQKDYIHAVGITLGFRFKDDLEFYFAEDEEVIHFRSAARLGYSDFGVNRERYNQLKEEYYAAD